jgi:hypothetical protein
MRLQSDEKLRNDFTGAIGFSSLDFSIEYLDFSAVRVAMQASLLSTGGSTGN